MPFRSYGLDTVLWEVEFYISECKDSVLTVSRMITRKKSGAPVEVGFERSLVLLKFSSICSALNDSGITASVPEAFVAKLSFSLQNLMEKFFGRYAAQQRNFTKLPSRLFKDYGVPGPHYTILHSALKHLKDTSIPNLEDPIFEKYDDVFRLFSFIESELLKEGFLKRQTIFFTDSVSSMVPELTQIVTSHNGIVVNTRDYASHIIEWDEDVDGALPEELAEEFIRTIEMRFDKENGSVALVHWWYHPDSYDEWIPADEVDFSDPPDAFPIYNASRQWRVCCRFIRDLELFNEWGNEIDYEMDEEKADEDEQKSSASGSVLMTAGNRKKGRSRGRRRLDDSRKRAREQQSQQLQQNYTPIPEALVSTEKMAQDVPPPSGDVSKDTYRVLVIGSAEGESGSQCVIKDEKPIAAVERQGGIVLIQGGVGSGGWVDAAESAVKEETNEPEEKRIKTLSPSIPRPPWFNAETVSALEVRYLPEFFNDTSRARNTQSYLSLRNFLISLYDQHPSVYLSATDARKKLSGDVCMILRVHEFLDSFGVINSEVKPESRPQPVPLFSTEKLVDGGVVPGVPWTEKMKTTKMTETDCTSSSSTSWTWDQDQKLIRIVSASMESPDTGTGSVSAPDWNKVAREFESEGRTASDCLIRFVGLPLTSTSTSAIPAELTEATAGLSGRQTDNSISTQDHLTTSRDHHLRHMDYVASTMAKKVVDELGIAGADAVIKAAISAAEKEANGNVSSMSNRTHAASMGMVAAGYSLSVSSELQTVRGEENAVLDEYVSNRLQMLDTKMQLLESIQRDLEQERQRQELDRRDIQIQRVQLAFQQRERELRLKL
eukprot:gene2531-4925_t